ncbi:hypothetical protein [Stenotrophomonas sp. PS02299]|uniref:hypothetical protein n=1 Tax=Stenotrophomonas TaxID=40323 RepID=UPI00249ABBC5|nr:hypothetical protein [Stenotrophomonas sp. PS02299]
MEQSAQAAWVQAIFSIFGIAVAIAVPWWQHREAGKIRAQENKVKAVSKASALMKDTIVFGNRIDSSRNNYLSWADGVGSVTIVNWPGVPDGLSTQADSLHVLGEPGSHLIKAIYHSRELKDVVGTGYLKQEDSTTYKAHIDAAYRHVQEALKGMRALIEE